MVQHQPAFSTNVINQPSKRYLVIDVTSNNLVIESNPVAVPGLRVSLLDTENNLLGYGYIRSLNPVTVQPLTDINLLSVYIVEIQRVWSPTPESIRLLTASVFTPHASIATLNAVCSVPQNYTPGFIRWSLFYLNNQTEEEVIKGHDYLTPGVCSYSYEGGQWIAGEYTIVAQRYLPAGNLAAQDSRSWILTQPTTLLSCGGYNDTLSPLCL